MSTLYKIGGITSNSDSITLDSGEIKLGTDGSIPVLLPKFTTTSGVTNQGDFGYDDTNNNLFFRTASAINNIVPASSTGLVSSSTIILPEQTTDATPQTNKGLLYSKDSSSISELFWKGDGTSAVTQLTKNTIPFKFFTNVQSSTGTTDYTNVDISWTGAMMAIAAVVGNGTSPNTYNANITYQSGTSVTTSGSVSVSPSGGYPVAVWTFASATSGTGVIRINTTAVGNRTFYFVWSN